MKVKGRQAESDFFLTGVWAGYHLKNLPYQYQYQYRESDTDADKVLCSILIMWSEAFSGDSIEYTTFNFTAPQAEWNSATEGTKVIQRKYRLIGELWILHGVASSDTLTVQSTETQLYWCHIQELR